MDCCSLPSYHYELFGSIATLIRVKGDDDILRIANDSRYGLGGATFFTKGDKAINLAKTYFDTGIGNVNGYGLANTALLFGDVKNSSHECKHGGFGIREFFQYQSNSSIELGLFANPYDSYYICILP